MTQKIIKIGSSLGVTVPKKYLDKLGLKAGDNIDLDLNKRKGQIEIAPAEETAIASTSQSEYVAMAGKLITEYEQDLKRLEN